MISEQNRKALLTTLHNDIHDCARSAATAALRGNVDYFHYPVCTKFSPEQLTALEKMRQIPGLQSALERIIAHASSSVVHTLLAYIDGIGDPEIFNSEWTGIALIDLDPASEDSSYLGELFYEYYWTWLDSRKS